MKTFDRFLPRSRNLTVLEIGGAPGRYLVYMSKNLNYKIHALDYSVIGCKKTLENFKLLGLEGNVYQKDLFLDDISSLPRFDIVYSLGFIEHFANLETVIEKHALWNNCFICCSYLLFLSLFRSCVYAFMSML